MNVPFAWDVIVASVVSALVTLVAVYVGHKLALGQDRRREFNELADQMFAVLYKFEKDPTPYTSRPNDADFAMIERRMTWWQRFKFRRAVAKYKESGNEIETYHDGAGQVFYRDTNDYQKSIRQLMKHLGRR